MQHIPSHFSRSEFLISLIVLDKSKGSISDVFRLRSSVFWAAVIWNRRYLNMKQYPLTRYAHSLDSLCLARWWPSIWPLMEQTPSAISLSQRGDISIDALAFTQHRQPRLSGPQSRSPVEFTSPASSSQTQSQIQAQASGLNTRSCSEKGVVHPPERELDVELVLKDNNKGLGSSTCTQTSSTATTSTSRWACWLALTHPTPCVPSSQFSFAPTHL